MNIYKRRASLTLQEIESAPFELEDEIQDMVEKNLDILFELTFAARKFRVEVTLEGHKYFEFDTLAYDKETKAFVVIEYKKSSSSSVIDQGAAYLSAMLTNKSNCILEYQERTGEQLKRKEIDWGQSRVIFIAPAFNKYQRQIGFIDLPLELWEIEKFGKDLIVLQQLKSTSKERVSQFKSSEKIAGVLSEIQIPTERDLTVKCNKNCLNLWGKLRDHFLELGDINLKATRYYIAVKKNNKNLCRVSFTTQKIRINIHQGTCKVDGTKTKGFFEIEDPKKLGGTSKYKWPNGNVAIWHQILFDDLKNFDYIQWLIKQKYKTM